MKLFPLLLGLIAPAVIAQGVLEVVSLRHRTADQVIPTPGGPMVQETTVIQGAATGFDVVPRIAGSTVSGRLGEWIELGGATSAAARSDSGILSAREGTTTGSRAIWVKVEELR